jgi:hypothetical protein
VAIWYDDAPKQCPCLLLHYHLTSEIRIGTSTLFGAELVAFVTPDQNSGAIDHVTAKDYPARSEVISLPAAAA